jgi:hypothetical protein
LGSEPRQRLYDEDEAEARSHEVSLRARIKDAQPSGASAQEEDLRKFHKLYRVLRFYKAYEGFYTVSSTDYEPTKSAWSSAQGSLLI